jgi:hypothetical protein
MAWTGISCRPSIGEKVRRILGVSLENGIVSGAVVDAGLLGAKAVKSEVVALPAAAGERPEYITGTLKRWKKEYAPHGIVIGLPLKSFSHQLIEMPAMSRPDMMRALHFELEKYLPVAVDEYLFDFVSMPREKGRAAVLVFSIKKEIVDEIAGYAKEAELDVLSIRAGTAISLNSLLDVAGEKGISGLFVNITGSACEIVGLQHSLPVYVKGFPKGAGMAEEIERLSVLYPGKIYFMGNAEPSITGKFNSRKFEIPTANALAMSEVKRTRYPLNFLPPELIRHKPDSYPFIIGGFAAATLLLYLLTGMVGYFKDWRALRSIEAKRAAIREKEAGMLGERKKLESLQSDGRVLLDFLGRSNVVISALKELSDVLPKDAWLVSFSADEKGKVEIEGFTKKTSDLVIAIEKSRAVKNVSFSSPIVAKDGEERFSLKLEVDGQ